MNVGELRDLLADLPSEVALIVLDYDAAPMYLSGVETISYDDGDVVCALVIA